MGQMVVKLTQPLQSYGGSVVNILRGRRKRKRSDVSETSSDPNCNESQSPKRKKLLTTTQYIYQALFKEQKNSDITILALGKIWNLHKVYLSQSPYFYSMFNGSWRESCEDFVHIKILDERITLEALDSVFGSMYSDEIEIDPKAVVSVLATATLFHLEGIIDKCIEVMIETINPETAIQYYEAACQYGCQNVKKRTFVWLEVNLLCIYNKFPNLLRQVSIELMTDLISSPDLYVMQTEFSLYTLLRTWIYLRLHPNYDPQTTYELQPQQLSENVNADVETNGAGTSTTDVINSYFTQSNDIHHCCFLYRNDGQQFLKPFQALRTQYLTNHHMDLKIILSDNIIPREWIHKHLLCHWNNILKVDHLPEEGPQNVDAETFYKNAMRCGRILLEPGYSKWRWTGFHFGLDLILIVDGIVLSIRRHHRNEHERLLSLQTKRRFLIRVSVTSINSQRQPIHTQKSDVMSLCLEKNEEVTLMVLETKLAHPLLLSVNLLVVPPMSQSFKEQVNATEELNNAAIPISEIGANFERSITPTNTNTRNSADNVCIIPPSPNSSAVIPPSDATHRSRSANSTTSTASSSSASSASSEF